MTVLGLYWNPKEDTIALKPTEAHEVETITKRVILKVVASTFDPLGLFSPVTLNGKLLMQQLWKEKLDWDDIDEHVQEWKTIKLDLERIPTFKLKRCVTNEADDSVTYSLVCFCDASERAYSSAIYLRQITDRAIKVELIFSKARLAPVKGMTIPKLEIMAVVIGVRCLEYVQSQVGVPIEQSVLYTDSQCVLKWISSEKKLPVFVQNRVNEIKKHTGIRFAYVKTTEYPADIATRGYTVEKLTKSELWWNGPSWLMDRCYSVHCDSESTMCVSDTCVCVELGNEPSGENENQKHELKTSDECDAPFDIRYDTFSSVTRLIRVTAYVKRYLDNLRSPENKKRGALSTSEICEAEWLWLKYIQKKHYGDVYLAISSKKPNNLQRQLNLTLDDRGSLRCRGRLQYAELTEGSRNPILLPRNDRFTQLLIEQHHKQIMHCGVSQTLSCVRYKYWIPQGRAVVKSVLRQCNVCRRSEGGPYKVPEMPPLPKSRVTSAQPFTNTGLDYLGPLYIKSAAEKKKIWVCLFTCLVTRAIHLEVVQDMSSEEFLLSFRRFVALRGVPNAITSDNALQFKTAGATMDMLWSHTLKHEDVTSYMSENRIKWHFIVERAPWFGGFYERLVGLVKRPLRKTLGRKLLTLIQMQTVMREVEAVVNARPLVYVDDDINSTITLTPGHFLTLNPRVGVPEIDDDTDDLPYIPCESTADKLLAMWKKGNSLLNLFWKMWRDDYLLSLRERTQTHLKSGRIQSSAQPCAGDVILVKDELPRGCWKMGKIKRLRTSGDGYVRSAEVQLASGRVIRRPLNLMFPIETSKQHSVYIGEARSTLGPSPRPQRKAAIEALHKIRALEY
ncbi:uncharacterized protein LOC128206005 [Mya arenaria]|uniref:uncharacterized protein LOC128206005 n=1 Tax=Mya arenaria TaxID=6604 RepID=UPI0022E148E7|nr:uncharacterized protein LOC128206005 [Mya arenaria]